jgi:hypothetical protein
MAYNERTTTYDPSEVVVTFGELRLSGYADGTVIKVERTEERYATKVGLDGEGGRARNNNRAGTIEVTLLQTSASNASLSLKAQADDDAPGGLPPEPLIVKDLQGNSLHVAAAAWIQKLPSSEYAKETGERTWVFGTANLRQFDGGN